MNENLVKNVKKWKFYKDLIFFISMNLVAISFTYAQTIVTGTVTDNAGNIGLPGVSVSIKNSNRGVISDFDGNYSIEVESGNAILVFSYMGFASQEILVESKKQIDVVLKEDVSSLDEIVVVGYGTQSKRNITGAISSINMEDSNKDQSNVSVTQSLSGVAGVQFIGDGRPGQTGDILIRGQNSLSGDNNPLIVLDGIIFNGSLNDVNPQDIETIDILKDASSAAIYGSRASNGVILITSKRGTTTKPTVNVNVFSGLSESANRIKLLSPERYLERRLDWRRATGQEANAQNIASYLSPLEADNYLAGRSTDSWDVISQQGSINSIDLNVSGRSESVNYYLSSSLSENKGLIYNDQEKRLTFRSNVDVKLADWIKAGINTTFSRRDLSGIEGSLYDAYRTSPYGTYFNEDGTPARYPVPSEQAATNSIWLSNLTTNEDIANNLFSNFYTELNSDFLGGTISYRVNFSPNIRWSHDYNYVRQDPRVEYNNTSASKYNRNDYDWLFENFATYKRKFGYDHGLDVTLLYSRNHTQYDSTTADAEQLSVDGLGFNNLGLGAILSNSSFAQNTDGVSYMGRINYQFKNRYLFTLTARRDGSSVFSTNNKYATFPSGAFAWILSDEPFMKENSKINLLKLRLSYGAVGNQAISPYQSLSLSSTERYVFGDGGTSSLGVVTSSLGNSELKWETTYTSNLALDFNLFDSRLGGTLEFYDSKTKDLLVRRSIPVMGGYTSVLTNIGETNNRGVELLINTTNIRKDKFEWSSNLNFSYNRNKIVSLFGTDLDNDGKEDDSVANSWFIGQPINSYYDYKFDGIYQEGDTDIPEGSKPGFVRVKDLNGDGVITPADRTVVGSGQNPDYVIGLRNTFTYGNLSLSIFVNAMLGWEAPFNLINPLVPDRSFNQIDAGWWTPENKSNNRPGLDYSNPLNTNWYVSRDFLRIRDLSLGYQFEDSILEQLHVSNLRISLSVKNLYTFTKWLGSDPETNEGSFSEQGSDGLYPMPRTFSLGLNLGF